MVTESGYVLKMKFKTILIPSLEPIVIEKGVMASYVLIFDIVCELIVRKDFLIAISFMIHLTKLFYVCLKIT